MTVESFDQVDHGRTVVQSDRSSAMILRNCKFSLLKIEIYTVGNARVQPAECDDINLEPSHEQFGHFWSNSLSL